MRKKLILSLILVLILALTLCACSDEGAYLTINGEPIDDAVYLYHLRSSMKQIAAALGGAANTADFWESEINGETMFSAAAAMARDRAAESFITDKKFDEYALTVSREDEEALEKQYTAMTRNTAQYSDMLETIGITDEAFRGILLSSVKQAHLHEYLLSADAELFIDENVLRGYYDETYLSAKHIFFATTDENGAPLGEELVATALHNAQRTIADLHEGESFDMLMLERSEDMSTRASLDGTLFLRESADPEFLSGYTALSPGQYSTEPLLSSDGYHIIMRLDTFEQNYERLYHELSSSSFTELIESWVEDASIVLNESRLRRLDPVELLNN